MAHYAKLGINSKVINVEVVANSDCQNADGVEDEEVGRQFLERIHNWPLWKKTSYNDIFMPTKPYTSWVLNTAEARWQSPIGDAPELSEDEKETHRYDWNESGQSWDKVEK